MSWNPEAYTLYEYRTRTIAFNQRRRIFQLKSHGSCTTRSLKFKASNFKFCFLSNTMYQETSVSKDLDLSNFKQNIKTTRMSNDGISAKRIADMKGQGRFKRNGGSATEPGCDHHSPEPQYKHKVCRRTEPGGKRDLSTRAWPMQRRRVSRKWETSKALIGKSKGCNYVGLTNKVNLKECVLEILACVKSLMIEFQSTNRNATLLCVLWQAIRLQCFCLDTKRCTS